MYYFRHGGLYNLNGIRHPLSVCRPTILKKSKTPTPQKTLVWKNRWTSGRATEKSVKNRPMKSQRIQIRITQFLTQVNCKICVTSVDPERRLSLSRCCKVAPGLYDFLPIMMTWQHGRHHRFRAPCKNTTLGPITTPLPSECNFNGKLLNGKWGLEYGQNCVNKW